MPSDTIDGADGGIGRGVCLLSGSLKTADNSVPPAVDRDIAFAALVAIDEREAGNVMRRGSIVALNLTGQKRRNEMAIVRCDAAGCQVNDVGSCG